MTRLHERHIDDVITGKTMIEFGSHQGYNTIPLARYYDSIICVEPFAQNTDAIRYNLLANDIRNVHVYENSGSDKKGVVTLSQHDARITFDEEGGLKKGISDYYWGAKYFSELEELSEVHPVFKIPVWHEERKRLYGLVSESELEDHTFDTVDWHMSDLSFSQVVTVDDFIYLQPSLLKIDVEGQEYETVLGAIQTIELFSPNILIEIHETISVDPRELYQYFTFDRYDLYCLERGSSRIFKIEDKSYSLEPDSYLIGLSKK